MGFLRTATFAGVVFACTSIFAAQTVTLQQDVNGYTGTQDLSLYKDNDRSISYSNFYTCGTTGVKPAGSSSDRQLTTTQFTC